MGVFTKFRTRGRTEPHSSGPDIVGEASAPALQLDRVSLTQRVQAIRNLAAAINGKSVEGDVLPAASVNMISDASIMEFTPAVAVESEKDNALEIIVLQPNPPADDTSIRTPQDTTAAAVHFSQALIRRPQAGRKSDKDEASLPAVDGDDGIVLP